MRKKMGKKALALLLALIMVLSLVPTVALAVEAPPFSLELKNGLYNDYDNFMYNVPYGYYRGPELCSDGSNTNLVTSNYYAWEQITGRAITAVDITLESDPTNTIHLTKIDSSTQLDASENVYCAPSSNTLFIRTSGTVANNDVELIHSITAKSDGLADYTITLDHYTPAAPVPDTFLLNLAKGSSAAGYYGGPEKCVDGSELDSYYPQATYEWAISDSNSANITYLKKITGVSVTYVGSNESHTLASYTGEPWDCEEGKYCAYADTMNEFAINPHDFDNDDGTYTLLDTITITATGYEPKTFTLTHYTPAPPATPVPADFSLTLITSINAWGIPYKGYTGGPEFNHAGAYPGGTASATYFWDLPATTNDYLGKITAIEAKYVGQSGTDWQPLTKSTSYQDKAANTFWTEDKYLRIVPADIDNEPTTLTILDKVRFTATGYETKEIAIGHYDALTAAPASLVLDLSKKTAGVRYISGPEKYSDADSAPTKTAYYKWYIDDAASAAFMADACKIDVEPLKDNNGGAAPVELTKFTGTDPANMTAGQYFIESSGGNTYLYVYMMSTVQSTVWDNRLKTIDISANTYKNYKAELAHGTMDVPADIDLRLVAAADGGNYSRGPETSVDGEKVKASANYYQWTFPTDPITYAINLDTKLYLKYVTGIQVTFESAPTVKVDLVQDYGTYGTNNYRANDSAGTINIRTSGKRTDGTIELLHSIKITANGFKDYYIELEHTAIKDAIALTADSTHNTRPSDTKALANDIEITYDATKTDWQGKISSITLKGPDDASAVTLAADKYDKATVGKIVLNKSLFSDSGTGDNPVGDYAITINATGYQPSTVTQTIKPSDPLEPYDNVLTQFNVIIKDGDGVGVDKNINFTMYDIRKVALEEGNGTFLKYDYSVYNSYGTYDQFHNIEGATIEGLLKSKGLDIATLANDRVFTFWGWDEYNRGITKAELFKTRYYYPNNVLPPRTEEGAVEVPAIIAFLDGKEMGRNFYGQTSLSDMNKPNLVQRMFRNPTWTQGDTTKNEHGWLIIGASAGQYDAPVPSIASGSTVAVNSKLDFTDCPLYNVASLYYTYTTDGTEPADPNADNAIKYNMYGGSFQPLNFTVSATYKVKAVVIGAGKSTSDIVNLTYTVSNVTPESVTVTNANSFVKDTTLTLTAEVLPENTTNKSVTWSIVAEETTAAGAQLSNGNELTATGAGAIKVKATSVSDPDISGSLLITVTDSVVHVNSVSITGGKTLAVGASETLKAVVSPENATNKAVAWSIYSGSAFASIDPQSGELIGLAAGSVTVKAITADMNQVAIYEVEIVAPKTPVTKITVSGTTAIQAKQNTILLATVEPDNASVKTVAWSITSGAANAVIDENTGVLTGVAQGSVTVRATAKDGSGVYGEKTLTIYPETVLVSSVTISGAQEVAVGAQIALHAAITPADATYKMINWSVKGFTGEAAITTDGVLTGVKPGTVIVTASSSDGSGASATHAVEVKEVTKKVLGVTLGRTLLTLGIGEAEAITATVLPIDATNKNVSWTTSDEKIATVKDGIVTAVAIGEATVTATTEEGGYTSSCKVVVTSAVSGVTLDKSELTLAVDELGELTATVLPETATNKKVSWFSSDEDVALVSEGRVRAVAPGTTTILVVTNDGQFSAKCKVTVVIAVAGVSLDKSELSLTTGDTAALTATIEPQNATNKNIIWTTADAAIATVENGAVTAVAAGVTTVTATTEDGGFTAECSVTVAEPIIAVTGVSLDKSELKLITGETAALTATIEPQNATNKNIIWTTADAAIATVENGAVTAVAAGVTTITATTEDGGFTAECSVTVAEPVETGWVKVDGKWFYGENGKPLTGAQTLIGYQGLDKLGENEYFFNEDGTMFTGFKKTDAGWVYYGEEGKNPQKSRVGQMFKNRYVKNPLSGYVSDSEKQARENGKELNYYYYFDAEGVMITGWLNSELTANVWRYMGEDGTKPTTSKLGRRFTNGALIGYGNGTHQELYYKFSLTGGMMIGHITIKGVEYFFNTEGLDPSADLLGAAIDENGEPVYPS